jgi:hypothetical protein
MIDDYLLPLLDMSWTTKSCSAIVLGDCNGSDAVIVVIDEWIFNKVEKSQFYRT